MVTSLPVCEPNKMHGDQSLTEFERSDVMSRWSRYTSDIGSDLWTKELAVKSVLKTVIRV